MKIEIFKDLSLEKNVQNFWFIKNIFFFYSLKFLDFKVILNIFAIHNLNHTSFIVNCIIDNADARNKVRSLMYNYFSDD